MSFAYLNVSYSFSIIYNRNLRSIFVNDSCGALSENGSYRSFDLKWRGSIETTQYQSSSLRTSSVVLPARRLTNSKGPSIVWAFARSFAGTFVAAALFKFAHDLLLFASPQLLKYVTTVEFLLHNIHTPFSLSLSLTRTHTHTHTHTHAHTHAHRLLINFTVNSSEPSWRGYFYAFLLFLVGLVQSLFLQQYFHHCLVVGMRVRTAVIAAVYNKVRP